MADPQHALKVWLARKLEPHGEITRASEVTGMSKDQLGRSKEVEAADPKKRRRIQPHEIEKLARHFDELPPGYEKMTDWVSTPATSPSAVGSVLAIGAAAAIAEEQGASAALVQSTMPVVGFLGAGAEIDPDYEQVPPEGLFEITVPFQLPDDMLAFQVRGDSMRPVYRDGHVIIVYREQRKPIESFYGYEAAVRTDEGRRFVKTITRGPEGTVTLNSWNADPIERQRLAWIGEIFAVLPPAAVRHMARQAR